MAIASILLGIGAFIAMILGVVLTIMPYAGSVFSFGAVIMALAGIVLGGLAISRAKQDDSPTTAATVGLVISIISFVFSLLVALTCGLCNACMSASPQGFNSMHPVVLDGGGVIWTNQPVNGGPAMPMMPEPTAVPSPPPSPAAADAPKDAPPPAFPPPPIAPNSPENKANPQ